MNSLVTPKQVSPNKSCIPSQLRAGEISRLCECVCVRVHFYKCVSSGMLALLRSHMHVLKKHSEN